MIKIEERITKKVPGETSLFVSFNYNTEYLNIMKQCEGSHFDKKSKEWETPLSNLSKLLDEFCVYEDIDLQLLKYTEPDNNIKRHSLSQYKLNLYNHQVDAINYGLEHNKWLLLDSPGLGKSFSIIALAQELKLHHNINHCLVVCGLNVLKNNWRKEIQKCVDLDCIILGEKVNKKGKRIMGSIPERVAQLSKPINEFFIITNIETLRNDNILKALLNGPNKPDMLVIDEMQTCLNPSARQTSNLLKLNKTPYIVGATGTPIMNSPLDTYVPLKLIGADRSTFTNFKYYYCSFGGPFHNIVCGFKNMEILRDIFGKYSLRRTKDLLDLPPKIVIKEYVDMEEDQSQFYDNIKQGIKEQVDKVELNTTSLFSVLTRLRQATECTSILTTEDINTAKIERACSLAEEIIKNGDKVVIFCNFKETVKTLANLLKQYNPLINTGDIQDNIISENVDKFQKDPKYKIFIGTYAKCSTGLTLTAASHMICMSQCWTASQNEQAQDRIHRIGTSNKATIYYLITSDTVDEKVDEIVEDKSAISDYLIDGEKITEQALKKLQKYIEDL